MSKLDALCQQINKEWKEDIANRGIKRITTKKIPFTSPRLNYMLYGGLPRGRIIEFAGEENGGRRRAAVCRRGQLPWRSCLRGIYGDEESVPQGIRGLLLPIRPILPSGRNPVLRRSPSHRSGICREIFSGI